jgi:protein involved in polysaccharide export with SLBB domain
MAGKRLITLRVFGAFVLLMSAGQPAHAQSDVDDALRRASTAKVRPGDRIGLNFLRERQLSESLFVDERGEVAFPKIGIMKVSDMSIMQLQDTLRARYAEFLRLPELQIAVLRRVVVNGEVRLPNVYLMDAASSTVRDLIARAGGITEMGSRGKVYVVRDGQRIRIQNWEREFGPAGDIQSGDQVLVGRRSWFAVNALSVISTAVLVTSFVISVSQ